MALNIKDAKKSAPAIVCPTGAHLARCYSLVDLGTHTTDGRYGVRTNRKLRFSWELPEDKHVFDEKRGPEPLVLHHMINFTSGPKSPLIKLLTSWRGKAFTPEEFDDFDLRKVLGKACLVNVVHTEKEGVIYANVENVTPVPLKWRDQVPSPINPQVYYEVEHGKNDVFQSLPEWLRTLISGCEEWKDKPKKEDRSNDPLPFDEDDEQEETKEEKDGDMAF